MWLWAAFIVFILFLLALDLGVFHRRAHAVTFKEALILSGAWICVALAFNVFVYFAYEYHWFGLDLPDDEPDGRTAAVSFLIVAGVALIQRFEWVLYLFGAVLVVSGVRMATARDAPDPERIPSLLWQDGYCRSLTSSPESGLLCGSMGNGPSRRLP